VLLEGESATEEMAARFVSKIPMISGSTLFPGLFDIWLTSDVSEERERAECAHVCMHVCAHFLL
jgi:hypothetical protein